MLVYFLHLTSSSCIHVCTNNMVFSRLWYFFYLFMFIFNLFWANFSYVLTLNFSNRSTLSRMQSYLIITSLLIAKICWYALVVHRIYLHNVALPFRFLSKSFFFFFVNLNQKIAAVLDQLPLSLHDKYLFCMR